MTSLKNAGIFAAVLVAPFANVAIAQDEPLATSASAPPAVAVATPRVGHLNLQGKGEEYARLKAEVNSLPDKIVILFQGTNQVLLDRLTAIAQRERDSGMPIKGIIIADGDVSRFSVYAGGGRTGEYTIRNLSIVTDEQISDTLDRAHLMMLTILERERQRNANNVDTVPGAPAPIGAPTMSESAQTPERSQRP